MHDLFVAALEVFFRILAFVLFDAMWFGVFYYIGAFPVWVITRGRLPTRDIYDLPRRDRNWYGLLGVMVVTLLAGSYFILI